MYGMVAHTFLIPETWESEARQSQIEVQDQSRYFSKTLRQTTGGGDEGVTQQWTTPDFYYCKVKRKKLFCHWQDGSGGHYANLNNPDTEKYLMTLHKHTPEKLITQKCRIGL